MATDTTKITGAADDLSDKLTKGGGAAKTLGAEIANAIKSLDGRVAALEAGGGTTPIEPPIEPPAGSTGGKITNFTSTPKQRFQLDSVDTQVHTAGRTYSIANPDEYTLRFEAHNGDYAWYDSSGVNRSEVEWTHRVPADQAIEQSFQLMIEKNGPNGFVNTANSYFITGQWHNDDDSGGPYTSPPLYFTFVRGPNNPWDPGDHIQVHGLHGQYPSTSFDHLLLWTDPNPIVCDVYHKVRIEVKFQTNNNGYARVWIDDVQRVDYRGPIGFGRANYFAYGIYRSAAQENASVKYKNMTI